MRYFVAYIVPAIVILVSIPLVLGKVSPNGMYGFRTPKTLSSPDIWYPANRAAGWFMIAAGILAACLNSVLLLMAADWPERTLFNRMSASAVGWLLLSLAASFIYLRRL